jgi:hypothetical protein
MVAAAVIGGAVVAAGATAYAGSQAASATKDASSAAIDQQKAALDQQATLNKPYRDLGTTNMSTYQNLLTGDPATQAKTLESLPGYQFTKNQGIEDVMRAASSSGLNLSGNQVVAVQQYGSNLADQTFQQQLNNLLQPVQLGEAAAAGQAANVGTSASTIGNTLVNQGNTNAGITANEIAGLSKIAGTTSNSAMTYGTLNSLNTPGTVTPTPTYGDPNAGLPSAGGVASNPVITT